MIKFHGIMIISTLSDRNTRNNQYKYSLRYFNAFQITCKFKGNKPDIVNQYLNYLESRDMSK